MFLPLHRVQVNTLFVHFPDWAEIAHVGDPGSNFFDYIVNIFFCGKPAEAEPEGRMCEVIAEAKRYQYIGMFERCGGTGLA